VDSARAALLYVSDRPEDHPQPDFERQRAAKARIDSIYAARARGAMRFRKTTYRSPADGLEVPAYVFAPLAGRAHPALVWVHGGVHASWDEQYVPFVLEAVRRGYVVVAPDYRGSTGYGPAHYNAIDYGGREVDDVLGAFDLLKTMPEVDTARVGVMGWSHGGFITAHLLFRGRTPFRSGAAIVPVTNLIFRLSYKGPGYQRSFATQAGIRGLPFERREEYVRRSPVLPRRLAARAHPRARGEQRHRRGLRRGAAARRRARRAQAAGSPRRRSTGTPPRGRRAWGTPSAAA
jgi:dipeptidyl aminopeptidase/acylaminoacyl peptidase